MRRLYLTDEQAHHFMLAHREEFPDAPLLEGFDEWFKEKYGRVLFVYYDELEQRYHKFHIDFKTDVDMIEFKLTYL